MSKFYDFGYQFSQPSGMDSDIYGGVLKRLDELNDIFLATKKEVNAANVSSSLTEQGKRERRHELAEQVERKLDELERSAPWTGYAENIKAHEARMASKLSTEQPVCASRKW